MMLINQSFIRNLLVVLALCVLLAEAAPISVRKSRESGSFETPLLTKRSVIKPAFAPYRLMKRQAAPSSAASSSSSAASSSAAGAITITRKFKTTVKAEATSVASISSATDSTSATFTNQVAAAAAPSPSVVTTTVTIFGQSSSVPSVPAQNVAASGLVAAPASISASSGGAPAIVLGSASPTASSAPSASILATGSTAAAQCTPTVLFNQAELHANPQKNIVLWKGVVDDEATVTNLISNPNPPRNEKGDFSATGAFYLTDTWQAAAQAACFASGNPVDQVALIQYNWVPDQDTLVAEFENANDQWGDFVSTMDLPPVNGADMIAGPLSPTRDITTMFWQYAINSDRGMEKLSLQAVYQPVQCSAIPKGNCLPLV